MSKGKKSAKQPAAPAFAPSQTMYGNQVIGKTFMGPNGQITNQYLPTPDEQQRQTLASQQINQLLPQIGQTSPEMSKQYDSMANAFADNATAAFNRQYEPAQRATREDYASRFGGLANTPYLDAMNNMETQVRVPAMVQIGNDAATYKQNLYNQDQQNKMNQLQSLGYVLNNNQQNFLNGLNNNMNSTNTANNFNNNQWQTNLSQFNANRQYNLQAAQANNQAIQGYIKAGASVLGAL